jgi:hypothetical protein
VDKWPSLFASKEQDEVSKGEAVDALLQSFDILPKKYSTGFTTGAPVLKAGYSHFEGTRSAIHRKTPLDRAESVNTFAFKLGLMLRNIIFDEHEKTPKPFKGFEDSYVQRTEKFANAFWALYVEWLHSESYIATLQEAFKRRYRADPDKWREYYALAILMYRMDGKELDENLRSLSADGSLPGVDGLFSRFGKKQVIDDNFVKVAFNNMLDVFEVKTSEWTKLPYGMKEGYSRFGQTQAAIFAAAKDQSTVVESFALELGTAFAGVLAASKAEFTPVFLPYQGFEQDYVQNTPKFVDEFLRLQRAWRELGSAAFVNIITREMNERSAPAKTDLYYSYCAMAILFSRMGGEEVSAKFEYRASPFK